MVNNSSRWESARDYDWVQKEVVRLYVEEEWSTRDIASEFGIDKSTVSAWLRKQGVEIRAASRTNTSRSLDKLRAEDRSYLHTPESIAKMAKTKKGKPVPQLNTPEVIAKRNTTYTSEKHSEVLKKNWQDPAYREKMSKARSKTATRRWSEGNWRNSTRNSKVEYEFAPILAEQGFAHNVDSSLVITSGTKTRLPDFYDLENKRVVEVWGRYWHAGEDPKTLIHWYQRQGWECRVLWEDELP